MTDFKRTDGAKARTISRRSNRRLKGYRYPVYADYGDLLADDLPAAETQLESWHLLQAWQQAEAAD